VSVAYPDSETIDSVTQREMFQRQEIAERARELRYSGGSDHSICLRRVLSVAG
jgi:hypothetical protein